MCGRGWSKKPYAAVAFLVVSGGGGRVPPRPAGAIGSPGSASSVKTRSRAGTCVHSLRLSRYSFVALLLAKAPKPISMPTEAAVEATSALFIWSAAPYIGQLLLEDALGFFSPSPSICREQSLVFGSRPLDTRLASWRPKPAAARSWQGAEGPVPCVFILPHMSCRRPTRRNKATQLPGRGRSGQKRLRFGVSAPVGGGAAEKICARVRGRTRFRAPRPSGGRVRPGRT